MKLLSIKQFILLFFSFFLLSTGCYAQDSTTKLTTEEKSNSKPSGAKMSANPIIKIETNKGSITIELNAEKAPISSKNMVNYVKDGFYNGLIFHRVMPGFMIQGGGMKPDMSEKSTKAQIQNEANNGLKNDRGTLAMARTNIPHSASSQFFINLKDNGFLNHSSETSQGCR
jgi:cyclophilin family peptidyl-prolyl cis-trans isomerase